MTNAQMAICEDIYSRSQYLSEDNALKVLEFIDALEEHEPNEETIAAMEDAIEGRNLSKPYDDIDEMMKDILGHAVS